MKRRPDIALLVGVTVVSLGVLIAWPVGELLMVAFGEMSGAGGLERTAIVHTLSLGLSVSVIATGLGVGGAVLTERLPVTGRNWLRGAFVLPVLIPPFVSAMSWARVYGPSGLVDDAFGFAMPGMYGAAGITLVIAINAMPLAYVLAVSSLRSSGGLDGEHAARVSGASRLTAHRTITVPMMIPALAAAGALVFVVAINAFGVPAILGTPAGYETVTTVIYQNLARSARPESFSAAIRLATGLVAVATVFVVLGELALGRQREVRRTGLPNGVSAPPAGRGGWLSTAGWLLVAAAIIVPMVALVLTAITSGVGVAPSPANWTMANFVEAVDGRFLGALARSVAYAVIAATLALLLGAGVVVLRRHRFSRLISTGVLFGFAIPGSTLAVAMILSYGSVLRDTVTLILLAYVAKFWAIGHRALAGSADNMPADLRHAARVSGATSIRTLSTVVVPLLKPAIIGGWMLVFLFGFHELTMSSLLYGPGTDTLAVAVLNLQQLGDLPVAAALAVMLTLPMIALVILMAMVRRPSQRVWFVR